MISKALNHFYFKIIRKKLKHIQIQVSIEKTFTSFQQKMDFNWDYF